VQLYTPMRERRHSRVAATSRQTRSQPERTRPSVTCREKQSHRKIDPWTHKHPGLWVPPERILMPLTQRLQVNVSYTCEVCSCIRLHALSPGALSSTRAEKNAPQPGRQQGAARSWSVANAPSPDAIHPKRANFIFVRCGVCSCIRVHSRPPPGSSGAIARLK
jgi:hypothetical protein